jgi:AcrR family transcriptional regulator
VGLATLYRQFPTRGDLIDAVYVAEVDALCQDTFRLAAEEDPWPALVAWVRHFITYIAIKRVLVDALDRESGTFRACRDALYEFGKPLLTRAQESGYANANLTIHDVLRYIVGVTGAPFGSNARRERILDIAVAGLAAPGVTATSDQRLRGAPRSTAPLLAHD